MAGQIRKEDIIQQEQIQAAFAEVGKSVDLLLQKLKSISDEAVRLNTALGGNESFKTLINLSKEAAKNTNELSAAEKEHIRIQKQLQSTIAKTEALRTKEGQKLVEEKVKLQEATRAARENAKEKLGLTKRSNGLRSAFGGLIKSIGIYAAAIFGLNRLIQFFTRDLLNMTKKLDSLDYSLKTVIKSQQEQAQTQVFLSDTAKNYGQDILTLTERYIKFRAAAQQSNLSVQATQKIFDSTAKAASVLGLKTDEVNGVFLALEQMISKGKVTTEELRRQLGERLPGSFGIMADAMGVSIQQLDKMLKAGEVLSSDALPKFADALEKAYGIEAVTKVNTLAAAQGRLRTAWISFVDELKLSKPYIEILNAATNFLEQINIREGIDIINDKSTKNIQQITDEVSKLNTEQERSEYLQKKINELKQKQSFENQQILKEEEEVRKMIGFQWKDRKRLVLQGVIDQRKIEISSAQKTISEITKLYNGLVMQTSDVVKITPFDLSGYKKVLDDAANEFETYTTTTDKELKKSFENISAFVKENVRTEEEYLLKQRQIKKSESDEAWKLYAELKNNESSLTKEQKQELDRRYQNYQNYIEAQIEIEKRLKKINPESKNEALKIAQEKHKQELSLLEKNQQETIQNTKLTEEQLLYIQYQNSQELLGVRNDQIDSELKLVKKGSADYEKLMSERFDILKNMDVNYSKWVIDEEKRREKELENQRKENERKLKEQSGIAYDALYDNIVKAQTERINSAAEEVKSAAGNAKKIKDIKNKLTIDLLNIEKEQVQAAIDGNEIIGDDEERLKNRILDILRAIAEGNLDIAENTNKSLKESINNVVRDAAQIAGQSFDIINGIYANQMARIEQLHDYEIAAAGSSVEKRLIAERKYQKEKAKIQRKQAIAEKAQTMFSIIINTASAIVEALPNVVLSVIIGALGAAQLAVVASQPIPEFKKGGKHKGGLAKYSEGGKQEIFIPDNGGSAILTPDSETISFMPPGEFIPHDETQKWLANYAVSQSYDMIDMSESNKHLKDIANNTKNRIEYFERNGQRFRQRGHILSRIV